MDKKWIEEIIDIAERRDLDALEIEDKHGTVRVVRRSAQAPIQYASAAQPAAQTESENHSIPADHHAVCSPIVGVFLATNPDEGTVLISVGDHVQTGQTLGFVEAMKMQTEVVSDCSGELVEMLVADQQAVQFNTPLFLLKPDTIEG
jgi:acetyl-CoA carboxylase biotin carboxyl carrier protein